MAKYSNQEYADIMFMYGRADGNGAAARRLYQERFPQRRIPDIRVFANTYRRISEHGNVIHTEPGPGRQIPHRHPVEIDEAIVEEFEADPTKSIRQVARQYNVSTWKVWNVQKRENKYPFHYTPVQGLEEGDLLRRINFCRHILNMDMENALFLKSILWTDESKFSREGITNFHNLHYWADIEENPHKKKPISFQNKFSVNVWAGIIGNVLIGPYYLPNNLNGDNYHEFLINTFPEILDEIPLNVRNQMLFQNDGCPAHWHRAVRQFLDEQFLNRWIGRNGPILWPARSPDLTPVDYYVWGRAKHLVYSVEIIGREQLIARIDAAFAQMRAEMRVSVTTTAIRKRARACIRNNGSHFEQEIN